MHFPLILLLASLVFCRYLRGQGSTHWITTDQPLLEWAFGGTTENIHEIAHEVVGLWVDARIYAKKLLCRVCLSIEKQISELCLILKVYSLFAVNNSPFWILHYVQTQPPPPP